MQIKNKTRILICGSAGIIGSYIIENKLKNAEIHTLDKKGSQTQLHDVVDLNDIEEVKLIASTDRKYDGIIYLTGLAHKKGKGADYNLFEKVNFQTLVNLVDALSNNGKLPEKIIFASTISVYGERFNQSRYNETLEPSPFSPYAVTKLQAEQYLLDNFGNKSWILRFAPVYSSKFLLCLALRFLSLLDIPGSFSFCLFINCFPIVIEDGGVPGSVL